MGNSKISLHNGSIISKKKNRNKYWRVTSDKYLIQEQNNLVLYDNTLSKIWSMKEYFGNWFQLVKGQSIYFLLPDDKLEVVDVNSGEIIQEAFLQGLKRTSNCVGGNFDIKNDLSYNKTSIYDVLVNDNIICWINTQNQVCVFDCSTNVLKNYQFSLEDDIYLAAINDRYILLYSIENYESGKLKVIKRRN